MVAGSLKTRQYLGYCAMLLLVCSGTALLYYQTQPLQITAFRANQLFFAGHYQQASELYAEVVRAGLHREELLARLGDSYLTLGQLDKALPVYVQLTRLAPANLRYPLKLAELYALDGRYVRAHALVQAVLGRRPDWHTACFVQARIFTLEGRFDEAIFEYDHILNQREGETHERH